MSFVYPRAIKSDGWIAAGETWTYSTADDPTFTFLISGDKTGKYQTGTRVKLTQTTAKYFIVTAVAYSAPNTTVTIYGGTDYDLANAVITNPFYSPIKAPFGFPMAIDKWSVLTQDTSQRSQGTPTASTWYNVGSLSLIVPIGVWRLSYQVIQSCSNASTTVVDIWTTLSTANDSESDDSFTSFLGIQGGSANLEIWGNAYRENVITLASKTTYYLNVMTDLSGMDWIQHRGDLGETVIKAECVYL